MQHGVSQPLGVRRRLDTSHRYRHRLVFLVHCRCRFFFDLRSAGDPEAAAHTTAAACTRCMRACNPSFRGFVRGGE